HTRCLSDWSSDVCSSDLVILAHDGSELRNLSVTADAGSTAVGVRVVGTASLVDSVWVHDVGGHGISVIPPKGGGAPALAHVQSEIGRASCRERGRGWGGA